MKILFISPTYSPVTHGPALTAQIISNIGVNPHLEIRIVSESYLFDRPLNSYLVEFKTKRIFHAWVKWIRMWIYFKKAKEIYKDYPFEYLVFNDALLGFFSAIAWRNSPIQIWGFLNDNAYLDLFNNVNKWKRSFVMECLHLIAEFGMVRLASGIFTCSLFLRDYAIKFYGIKTKNIKCLYPGISIDFWTFKKRDYSLNKKPEEILFLKSDFKNGGLEVLLGALSMLNEFSFLLHIAGTPNSQIKNLKVLVEKYSKVKVVIHGQVIPEQVRFLMHKCNTLCIPSINEGFGIANIEGLATGISVISTQVGGIPEILSSDKYGWLVPPEKVHLLANELKSCWNNPKERVIRSFEGRKMIVSKFTDTLLQENFISILSQSKG